MNYKITWFLLYEKYNPLISFYYFNQFSMVEDIKDQKEGKNTVALVWMICSIIWVILLLTIIGSLFWFVFLIIWFVLWIIGLFYKPRTKARIAVLIPAIIRICLYIGFLYIKDSIKTPALEFSTWFETTIENETYGNILEDDEFWDLLSSEFKNLVDWKSENEIMELYDNSNWSNSIEKRGYVFFGLIKDSIEISLEKYNLNSETTNEEISDIDEEDIANVEDSDENIDDEENDDVENSDENLDDEEDNENNKEETNNENKKEETKKAKTENVEVFNNWEKNDIEEIINILE